MFFRLEGKLHYFIAWIYFVRAMKNHWRTMWLPFQYQYLKPSDHCHLFIWSRLPPNLHNVTIALHTQSSHRIILTTSLLLQWNLWISMQAVIPIFLLFSMKYFSNCTWLPQAEVCYILNLSGQICGFCPGNKFLQRYMYMVKVAVVNLKS